MPANTRSSSSSSLPHRNGSPRPRESRVVMAPSAPRNQSPKSFPSPSGRGHDEARLVTCSVASIHAAELRADRPRVLLNPCCTRDDGTGWHGHVGGICLSSRSRTPRVPVACREEPDHSCSSSKERGGQKGARHRPAPHAHLRDRREVTRGPQDAGPSEWTGKFFQSLWSIRSAPVVETPCKGLFQFAG